MRTNWPPTVGKVYEVRDVRKGVYRGKCLTAYDEFATFQIVRGTARFLTRPDATSGDVVSARKGLVEFVPAL